MEREPPEAEVPGGANATFKHGEPTKVELTVRHLVDSWFDTDFTFAVDGDGVAYLRTVEPEGSSYHFRQNEQARQKAYDTVEQLPFVSEVERLHD